MADLQGQVETAGIEPAQDSRRTAPEITRLRRLALDRPDGLVSVDAAVQAVRATEVRAREEEAKTQEVIHREVERIEIAAARREAFREAVEALRERAEGCARIGSVEKAFHLRDNADFIERTFLSPDNPEGNA